PAGPPLSTSRPPRPRPPSPAPGPWPPGGRPKPGRGRWGGTVLTLPLRTPAVLARAAASLDLLSGGRFELGLGAGAFWDGIAAMGGPRRSPREAVDALSEAIDVIRAVWDPSERRGGPGRRGRRPGPP